MNRSLVLAITLVLALLAAACGDDDDATAVDDSTDTDGGSDPFGSGIDGGWTLVTLVEGGDMVVPMPDDATIDLDVNGSELGGTAACNSFGGTILVLDDGSVTVSELFSTEMACDPPELMELEARYLAALGAATSWALQDGQLTLTGPSAKLVYESTPVPDAVELTETVWQLDTFYDGSGPDGSATNQMGMEDVLLTVFDDAARVESPCGVIGGSAEYEPGGSGTFALALEPDEIDDDCPAEDRDLARDVLDRLDRVTAYEIEESRLTLSAVDGPVVGFVAS